MTVSSHALHADILLSFKSSEEITHYVQCLAAEIKTQADGKPRK
jgi:hypothetical protein